MLLAYALVISDEFIYPSVFVLDTDSLTPDTQNGHSGFLLEISMFDPHL